MRRTVAKVSSTLLGVLFAALIIIPWLGWIQQALKGNTFESSGIVFTAPARYWMSSTPSGDVSLWRYTYGVPLIHAPSGLIGFYPHYAGYSLDAKRDLKRVRAAVIEEGRSAGMTVGSERSLKTPAGTAACFQFFRGSDARVVCYFFGGTTLAVRYDGDEKFVEAVYQVVSSARLSQAPGAQ